MGPDQKSYSFCIETIYKQTVKGSAILKDTNGVLPGLDSEGNFHFSQEQKKMPCVINKKGAALKKILEDLVCYAQKIPANYEREDLIKDEIEKVNGRIQDLWLSSKSSGSKTE